MGFQGPEKHRAGEPVQPGACSSPTHPVGDLTGAFLGRTSRAAYVERVCPVCHRVQGVARVPLTDDEVAVLPRTGEVTA